MEEHSERQNDLPRPPAEEPKTAPELPSPDRHPERKLVEPESMIDEFFLDEHTVDREKRRVRKSLGMSLPTSHEKRQTFYHKLKVDLYKAGIDRKPSHVIKVIVYIALALLLVGALVIGAVSLYHGIRYLSIVFYLVLWSVFGFVILYSLSVIVLKLYLSYRMFHRRLEVEQVLPEFLRLVATNYRSGMPLDKALIKSNRPRFGIFSKEIELVAKTTRVRGDLAKALEIFSKKFDSKILQRAINNIVMSVYSGSNISELLEDIASNITKMRNMRTSMAANVKNYVIFIIVAGVIIAPLMFSMSYVMNTTIAGVKGDMAIPETGQGMLSVSSEGGVLPDDFNVFAILMLVTNSVVSAFVISMIRYGNFQQGAKRIPIFLAISIVLYLIGKALLTALIVVI